MNVAALTGFRFFERRPRRHGGGFELRFSWAEITGGFGLALALCLFSDDDDRGRYSLHVHLGWPNIYLRLPVPRRFLREPRDGMEKWGFSVYGGAMGNAPLSNVHLSWGKHTKIVDMPWAWEWARSSYLLPDGKNWLHELKSFRNNYPIGTGRDASARYFFVAGEVPRWKAEHPYRYMLRSGVVQERTATIKVSEMEWRWKWFTKLPFPRLIRRTIDVTFSDEVGERSGSWKGGTIGCGYEIRYNETPRECLQRMERERKF